MSRSRACDACGLRKVRCTGKLPCPNCTRAGFECAFTKNYGKPGPRGPRKATLARVKKQLQSMSHENTENEHSRLQSPDVLHDGNSESSLPSPSGSWSPSNWGSDLPLSDVMAYLETYNERMYPVWPVVDVRWLKKVLQTNPSDCEICALAFAVCASTSANLQLNLNEHQRSGSSNSPGKYSVALTDRFAGEAERYRLMYDYRESSTREAILIPLFLHLYYSTKPKRQTTSLLLREAVTLCQFMGLDNEETYSDLDPEEESYRRRTFWLLYVTERGYAMQHDAGICLSEFISLPSTDRSESQILQAFNSLVHLFVSVDGVLVNSNAGTGVGQRIWSRETLSRIQDELRQHHQWPADWNEVQRSDVSITQQWLRMLVWQLSLKNVCMSSKATDDSMSFIYPAHVSRDALQSISAVSIDALVAHGPGMVSLNSNVPLGLVLTQTLASQNIRHHKHTAGCYYLCTLAVSRHVRPDVPNTP